MARRSREAVDRCDGRVVRSNNTTFLIWKRGFTTSSHAELYKFIPMPLWSQLAGGYLPVSSSPEPRLPYRSQWTMSRFTRNGPASFAFLAIALLTGLFGGYLLASPPHNAELCTFPFDTPNNPVYPETFSSQNTAHVVEGSLLVSDDLDLEVLRSIVAGSRGYYARDYSMGLGWNNVSHSASQRVHTPVLIHLQMRYIIETALHHGSLLNRTVIIPTYIYARSCEFEK